MHLKVLTFSVLVGFAGLGAWSARGAIDSSADLLEAQRDSREVVAGEEEPPALPEPVPGQFQAPPPPPALTDDPLGALKEKAKHKLFPLTESDEAYKAYHGDKHTKQVKTMDERGKVILFEGACGDPKVVGPCKDQLAEMDYGATAVRNRAKLAKKLAPFVPGITGDEAARRVARGRINWTIWSAGNDYFWDYMTRATLGGLDLLKTISSYDNKETGYSVPAKRSTRWKKLGLTNEPCFKEPTAGRADRFGLWLDVRDNSLPGCADNVDTLEDEKLFPGVEIGARGKTQPVGSIYGYATGVIGLRLFPNPDFDEDAKKKWDVKRFYEDPNYYNDPKLIRPYRVGMACAFCHVGPNPTNPPKDMNNPQWANLNTNPGAQYFWVDRILFWDFEKSQDNFIYQLLHTSRPGALDTSLISSDQINNPRTMNAVYNLPARMALAKMMGHREMLKGGELNNAQFNTVNDLAHGRRGSDNLVPANASELRSLYDIDKKAVITPRVLKDGSDSVGALGALNRVYVNIGLFSEEWVQNFIPLLGGAKITPFEIAKAQKKSLYWQANESQTSDTALYFLATTESDTLEKAGPIGKSYLKMTENRPEPKYASSPKAYQDDLKLGKKVYAVTCARCHSSKLPQAAYSIFDKDVNDKDYCHGENYLNCWNKYWAYSKTSAFRKDMEEIVSKPDFLVENFLSNDLRVPANLLDSNLCSPIATNAIAGNIWNDFSSSSYKSLPSIGTFKVAEATGIPGHTSASDYVVPAGGRGYLRPASLSSLWSTAPYLGNNSLGWFDWRGSIEGRMYSFEDSIRRLLWPQNRVRVYTEGKKLAESQDLNPGQTWPDDYGQQSGKQVVTYTTNAGKTLKGIMDVTTRDSYLKIPRGYLPQFLFKMMQHFAPEMIQNSKGQVAVTEVTYSTYGDNPKADYSEKEMADYLLLGPIPAGVPVNLISNIDLQSDKKLMAKAIFNLVKAVIDIKKQKWHGELARQHFMNKAASSLLKVSKCRDFVVNRGHYFGTEYAPDYVDGTWTADSNPQVHRALTDEEKEALIKFLKTF